MNRFYLKEVLIISGNPAADRKRYKLMIRFSSDSAGKCDINVDYDESIIFRDETKDRMEIYEFQLTFKEKELSFRLFAWDGGSYVRLYSERWLASPVFFQFLKNTYFSNQKDMMFMMIRRKSHKL